MIHTETIVNGQRRYYVDLCQNQCGMFVRITQLEIQTGNRNSVALPLQGMEQFRDALDELIGEFAEGYIGGFVLIDFSFLFLQFRRGIRPSRVTNSPHRWQALLLRSGP